MVCDDEDPEPENSVNNDKCTKAQDAEEQMPLEDDNVKPKKKKKRRKQNDAAETADVAVDDDVVEGGAATETQGEELRRKKQKRKKAAAEANAAEGSLEDVQAATAEANAAEGSLEEVRAGAAEAVEETEEVNGEEQPLRKKRKKKRKDADAEGGGNPPDVDENGEPTVTEQPESSDTKKKKKKKKKEEAQNEDNNDNEAERKESEEEAACLKVCVANLPTSMGKGHIWKMFEPCGTIEDVFLLKDWWTGGSRGVCFVTFSNAQGSHAALKQNGKEHLGQELRVNLALDRQQGKGAEKGNTGGKDCGKGKGKDRGKGKAAPAAFALGDKPAGCVGVIIKGLSYAVTEDDLKQCFAQCGDGPTRVRLLVDSWGESKGKAFLDFVNEAAVDEAIKLTGTKLKGRKLCVDYSRPRE